MCYDIYPKVLDMRDEVWSRSIGGTLLKTIKEVNGVKLYYKLPSYNIFDGFSGIESVAELIAQRIALYEGIDIVEQRLAKVKFIYDDKEYSSYCICSRDYTVPGELRMSLRQYCITMGHEKDYTEFIMSSRFSKQIIDMMKLDYIICNFDRHGDNIEVLYNPVQRYYRIPPLYDNGCSLITPQMRLADKLDSSYYLIDAPVNNYIGSMFLLSNLKDYCKGKIRMKHNKLSTDIMRGLDTVLDKDLYNFVYEMLKARYKNAVDILNS